MEGLWVESEEGMEEVRVRMYRIQGLTMRGEVGWGGRLGDGARSFQKARAPAASQSPIIFSISLK